jgi:hypothetical protein
LGDKTIEVNKFFELAIKFKLGFCGGLFVAIARWGQYRIQLILASLGVKINLGELFDISGLVKVVVIQFYLQIV